MRPKNTHESKSRMNQILAGRMLCCTGFVSACYRPCGQKPILTSAMRASKGSQGGGSRSSAYNALVALCSKHGGRIRLWGTKWDSTGWPLCLSRDQDWWRWSIHGRGTHDNPAPRWRGLGPHIRLVNPSLVTSRKFG